MHIALVAAQHAASISPARSLDVFRALALAVISFVLILITLGALWGPARQGNTRRVWDVISASLLAMIPGAIGVAGVGLTLGAAFLGWAVPGINS
jgi:hypothetical protein